MTLYSLLALPMLSIFYLFILYHYLIPRENCRKKLILCLVAVFLFQIPIRYCLLTDTGWIATYNIAKLLTILSAFIMIFLAGSYVYGGWAQVGLYMIFTEVIFALYERLYWQTWGYIAHATAEEITLQSQMLTWTPAAAIELIVEAGFVALLLIPVKKIRKYSVGQLMIVKIAVIAYLIVGSMPNATKTGFENGNHFPSYLVLSFDIFMGFFAILTIQRKMERESRQLLALRQYAFAAQTEALGLQKQKIRRFRHDIKRHLDAMSFLQEKRPELKEDPSFLQYRQELEQYRDLYRRGYYCDSDEMNTGMTQIDKYCVKNGIPITINMRRVLFPGWTREEQLQLGTLLYNLLTSLRPDQISGLRISGDEVQGQNILRLEVEYRTGSAPAAGEDVDWNNKDMAQETYYKDVQKLLSRHEGACLKQDTETGRTFTFLWKSNS